MLIRKTHFALAGLMLLVSQVTAAENYSLQQLGALDLRLPAGSQESIPSVQTPNLMLAANEQATQDNKATSAGNKNDAGTYRDRWFTDNKVRKYLGIGSIAAALLAGVSPKEEDGAHEYLAKASAVMAIGAVGTGLAYHHDDISMDGGFKDPDNLHALWAGLGAVGISMAAAVGPDSPHATYGSVGALGMIIGVKYTW